MGKEDPELSSFVYTWSATGRDLVISQGKLDDGLPQPTCFNIIVRDLSFSESFLCRRIGR